MSDSPTYQVLARKWRPQSFAQLVGQDSVRTALQNALEEGRVAQAYLFSGIRGVGKTTAARLFAKALNCERGPAAEPCNECATCREITVGSDLDVIEVDAATYSKVEQIRELTESLRYGPARDRFKVVVIDEIHRLSRQAFDALLKIVEEPPAHLTFIFATTESESVPATILSRCQEYRFRRVSADALTSYLQEISQAEKIDVGERALRLIARAGEGSVRDSVALLDQLATFGGGTIDDRDAVRLLGGLDTGLFLRLLTAMLAGRAEVVSAMVVEIEEQGWDPKSAYTQFLDYCRDALHLALGADREQVDLPIDDAERLAELASSAGYENLLRLLNQLLSSEQVLRKSESAGLALEIAWLRGAELPKLQRLEELLAGGAPSARSGPAGATPAGGTGDGTRGSSGRRTRSAAAESRAKTRTESTTDAEAEAVVVEGATTPTPASFLDRIRDCQPALRAHLETARLELRGGALAILENGTDSLLQDALERHRAVVDEAVAATFGSGATWRLITSPRSEGRSPPSGQDPRQGETRAETAAVTSAGSAPPRPPARVAQRVAPPSPERPRGRRPATRRPVAGGVGGAGSKPEPDPEALAEVRRDPTVQAVLEVFGGTIQSVETRSPSASSSDSDDSDASAGEIAEPSSAAEPARPRVARPAEARQRERAGIERKTTDTAGPGSRP